MNNSLIIVQEYSVFNYRHLPPNEFDDKAKNPLKQITISPSDVFQRVSYFAYE